ncbi:hypothetical protein A3I34_03105 [Candidatus Jorgensenbacteria bacterium RIFCSPLOWO2_02_FULL_45_12]|uniref:GP-PDE domain-containing protein n=2 Tax=Candidatus Joergenseniibacteriota TaxID=1752739 RepID=A0A1F6BNA8_9BACT|nr:MAG: Glycerophosphoryl diester phosphodiesterase [Candidatus Jorgensenbacteria bacterium GW2011_GWA2_45_9]OGG38415.1 MAG: hypothetical protein A3D55_00945 [Candidatus Jorgensenbacteria bacterium RIFCSPHIGHO2_02_FULL_45_20]OGG42425.1 MAG: hypothetical protein A3I34_03105 [Candidatus Jorgensenbacteria bacterium RIFCSPLOWO2_02_FULL_45_12]
MLIKIGHRGAAGYEPENTIAAFRRAIKLGADAIEVDVHLCKSGEVVAIHDDTVGRTTGGEGFVAMKTLAELRLLDAGRGEKIPTLEEVLDSVDKKATVFIELKGAGTAGPVSEIIRKYILEKGSPADVFWVLSFNRQELREFNKINTGGYGTRIKTGVAVTDIPPKYVELCVELGAQAIILSFEFVTKEFVDSAHTKGLKVFAWTVNEPDDIKKIKALGVDGILSDFPDRL